WRVVLPPAQQLDEGLLEPRTARRATPRTSFQLFCPIRWPILITWVWRNIPSFLFLIWGGNFMSISWLKKLVRKPASTRRSRRPSHHLHIEVLEDRTVLSFFGSPTFAVGTTPHVEAVGDFNGDGKADLVVVNQGSNTVSILRGNGDGTFQPRNDYAT